MTIDDYGFGSITIAGDVFHSDVIIYPNRVEKDWWRGEGHLLRLADIENAVTESAPDAVVVGTGAFGLMKIHQEVKDYLEENTIRLLSARSGSAVRLYNDLASGGTSVLGAFHLTC